MVLLNRSSKTSNWDFVNVVLSRLRFGGAKMERKLNLKHLAQNYTINGTGVKSLSNIKQKRHDHFLFFLARSFYAG